MPIELIETSKKEISKAKSTSISSYQEAQHGFTQSTPLLQIPSESLTHITSFLSPPSLLALSSTSQRLYEHIKDDNIWCRAFINRFFGIGPENFIENHKILLLRMSESTWRNEFIIRYKMKRRWERSRNGTITHSPQNTTIDGIHLMPENGLLTSSIQYGLVSRSLPLTGKVLKGYLDAKGTGIGIGNTNVEFTPNVSACSLNSDGGTAKIFWGKRDGEVAVTTAARAMDPRRVSSKLVRCRVEDQHDGAVNDIKLDAVVSRFISAGADGRVKLWDSKTVACLWSSDKKLQSLVADPFLKVVSSLADGIILGALNSGDILLWTSSQNLLSDDSSNPPSFAQYRITSPTSKEQPHSRDAVTYRPKPTTLFVYRQSQMTVAILIGYSNHSFFYRVVVDLMSGEYETIAFGDSSFGFNTIVEPVLAARPDDYSFVVTGDQLGFVSIYDWSAFQISSSVAPVRRFEAHEDGAVTALAWSSLVLATGSACGTTMIWDAVTLEPLRLFSAAITLPALGQQVGGVSKIMIEKELIIIITDNRVISWAVGQARSRNTPQKPKHTHAKKNPFSKGQKQYDLQKDINESRHELEYERALVQRTMGRECEQRSTLDKLGLSESEAVEYVLMLSREEEEHRRRPHPIDEGVFEDEVFFASRSSTTHGSSSHSSWNQSSSDSLYDDHSRAHPATDEKVQVVSPLRTPMAMLGSSTAMRSSAVVDRNMPPTYEHFPSISSNHPSSSSRLITSRAENICSAWVTSSSSCVNTPIPQRSNVSLSSATMDTHDRWSKEGARMLPDSDEVDDDLKFVIELSLAEAHSRGEVV